MYVVQMRGGSQLSAPHPKLSGCQGFGSAMPHQLGIQGVSVGFGVSQWGVAQPGREAQRSAGLRLTTHCRGVFFVWTGHGGVLQTWHERA